MAAVGNYDKESVEGKGGAHWLRLPPLDRSRCFCDNLDCSFALVTSDAELG